MAFRTPTLRNSIDLQYGQRVENSPTVVWITALNLRLSRCCPRLGRRCFGRADWSKVRGGRGGGWGQRGLPHALPSIVPVFSHRAPTA
jgi:hypothetical protein